MPIDYEYLRIVWWLLMGLLLILFAIMDGFDLGIAMMLLTVAKNDEERRIVLNVIGPTWEGNQVWFILGGGTIFAAWPLIYSVSFSGFYFPMLMVLLGLIIRPVGFKFRSKLKNLLWRKNWDSCLFVGAFIASLIFGVAIGNVLQGVPFAFDKMLHIFYTGSFLQLLNPFAILCGIASVCMLLMQGGIYLYIKTEGDIARRAKRIAFINTILFFILLVLCGIWIKFYLLGYVLLGHITPNGPSNPLCKLAAKEIGAWFSNYYKYPITLFFPISSLSFTCLTSILILRNKFRSALFASSLTIASTIAMVGVSMFPFILPSSSHPEMSLILWDSSSSQLTLFIMLIAAVIFLPLIILYTGWVYCVMRGKVTSDFIKSNHKHIY